MNICKDLSQGEITFITLELPYILSLCPQNYVLVTWSCDWLSCWQLPTAEGLELDDVQGAFQLKLFFDSVFFKPQIVTGIISAKATSFILANKFLRYSAKRYFHDQNLSLTFACSLLCTYLKLLFAINHQTLKKKKKLKRSCSEQECVLKKNKKGASQRKCPFVLSLACS